MRTIKMSSGTAIILDLDSTLIYTIDDTNLNELRTLQDMSTANSGSTYRLKFPDGTTMSGLFRPYLTQFLMYCRKTFSKLIVYTAGTEDYGYAVVKAIETKTKVQFDEVYARQSCLVIDDNLLYTEDTMRKPLKLVFPDIDVRHMLLVDDKMCNFRFNPRNGILIPAFSPQTIDTAIGDDYLLQLMNWFKAVDISTVSDYRLLNKDSIFDVDVIVELF